MTSLGSLRVKSLASLSLILLFILAACGTSGNTAPPSSSGGNGTTAAKGPITIGSKLDPESQLLGKMYSLLLQKAGYTVNEKLALGNSNFVLSAIKSGNIDLYPEFTATGLNALNIPSTYDPQKDYQAVKDGFNSQYQITWLDMSPLNDGYALCTSQAESQKLGVTTISQLVPKAGDLLLTSPSDGVSFVDGLKTAYGLTTKSFKKTTTVDYAIGFQAVTNNQAQMTVCYTTDGSVTTNNFIFLDDDKHGFPEFHPAPIVRNSVLQKYPDIATVLNPLAPDLTTAVSIDLQGKVATLKKAGTSVNQGVTQVATDFLKSKGLL
ncbi:MAG TPA: glycine betaine ABC transporter substrate-binding protein [Ktedonosporobacter sp.]|nr:glycine betaine ABC transporter substrate-binding protein [Ktedonosporobacter sp.]